MQSATANRILNRLLVTVAVGVFLAFGFIVASHAFTDGMCCGDDGAIALVAKNLANGHGYSLPLNFVSESGEFAFHPGITTGPTLILPAAVMIMAFGPEVWVPSVVTALIALLILSILVHRTRKVVGTGAAAAFAIAMVAMLYAMFGGEFFVHWYALLGEIPALLLLAAAAFVAAGGSRGDPTARSSFIAGALSGLAVSSKLLALVGALTIGGMFAWRLLRNGSRPAFRDGLLYTSGLLLPLLAFELFRLSDLGTHGYRHWLGGMWAFAVQQVPGAGIGTNPAGEQSFLARAIINLQSLRNGTGLGWTSLGLPLMIGAAWVMRERAAKVPVQASVWCAIAGLSYAVWWLGFSNGWPRYALIGLGLFAMSGAWAVAAVRSTAAAIGIAVAMLVTVIPWGHLERVTSPARYALENGFLENQRVADLRATAAYLDDGAGRNSVVAGSWWASLVALEYASEQTRRTVGFNRLYSARSDLPGTLVLRETKWDAMGGAMQDPAFVQFLEHCDTVVFSAPPYQLRRCNLNQQ